MTPLPTGSGWVCFDATALIHFNAVGALDLLGEWFPRAFAPNVVIEEEIRAPLRVHPANQRILDAPWLESTPVTELEDIRKVSEIHKRFGREPGKDRGEAELVVLCARHGWTAILDDTNGQRAARDYDARHCAILTMILAAAGHELIDRNAAWKLHGELEADRGGGRSALTAQHVHRPAFNACIETFAHLVDRGKLEWPHILSHPGADGLVIRKRKETR